MVRSSRKFEEGEIVVIRGDVLDDGLLERLVIVERGYGLDPTVDQIIVGEALDACERVQWSVDAISEEETDEWQQLFGKFGEEWGSPYLKGKRL